MEKKNLFLFSGITLSAVFAIVTLLTANSFSLNSAFLVKGSDRELSVTIDDGLTDSTSFDSGSNTVKTSPLNNDVTIDYSNVKNENDCLVLKQNEGYILNSTEIRSITTLEINGTGNFTLEWGWKIDDAIKYIGIVANFTIDGSRTFTMSNEVPNFFKLTSARIATTDSIINSVVATMNPDCVESSPVTVSLKSSDCVFISDKYGYDGSSKNAWNSYVSNPSGVYVLSGTKVGNEGLFFNPNKSSTLNSTFMVDSTASLLYVNHRTFNGTFAYRYRVNGDIVKPSFVSGDASKVTYINNNEEVQFSGRDGWTTLSVDLEDFIDRKVTVTIEATSGGDSALGGVYFPVITSDSGFIGDTYGADSSAKSGWTSFLKSPTSHYTLWSGANVTNHIANEGLKLHQNYNGFVQSAVRVANTNTVWTVNIRSFGDRNSQFKFYVNGSLVTPTLDKQQDSSSRCVVDGNSVYHAYDGWSTVTYDLSSYVGEIVIVKTQITANGDAMIGGFYFQ